VLNFVSDENLSYIRESGAVRVFSTLSSMNHPPLQQICSKGIYLLSLTESRRALLAERSTFLQSVFEMVKCQSQRTRLNVGSTVCNLIACPNTTTVMINSGALGVLKIIATIDNQDLREAVVRVILTLSQTPSLVARMSAEPVVPILVMVMNQDVKFVYECAIMAMSAISRKAEFAKMMIETGLDAFVATVLSGKVRTAAVSGQILRAIANTVMPAEDVVVSRDVASLLQKYMHSAVIRQATGSATLVLTVKILFTMGLVDQDSELLVVRILNAYSMGTEGGDKALLVREGAFEMLNQLLADFERNKYVSSAIYCAALECIHNLVQEKNLHEDLVAQGVLDILGRICLVSKKPTFGRGSDDSPETTGASFSSDASSFLPSLAGRPNTGSSNVTGATGSNSSTDRPPVVGNSWGGSGGGGSSSSGGGGGVGDSGSNKSDADTKTSSSMLAHKNTAHSVVKQANVRGRDEDALKEATLLYITPNEVEYVVRTLSMLSTTPKCCLPMVNAGVMQIFKSVLHGCTSDVARFSLALCLANMSHVKNCRAALVEVGAHEMMIALAISSKPDAREKCVLGLGYLSELTKLKKGLASALLILSMSQEDEEMDFKTDAESLDAKVQQDEPGNAKQLSTLELKKRAQNTKLATLIKEAVQDKKRFSQFFETLQEHSREGDTMDQQLVDSDTNLRISREHQAAIDEQWAAVMVQNVCV